MQKLENDKFYAIVSMTDNYVLGWYNNKVYLGNRVLSIYNKLDETKKNQYSIVEIKYIERVRNNE